MDEMNFDPSPSNLPTGSSPPAHISSTLDQQQQVSFLPFDPLSPLQSLSPFDFDLKGDVIELKPDIASPSAPEFSIGGFASNLPPASAGIPQPLDCLQGNPIPPFLSKTYDLVDEPSLDPIISWALAGKSFVVWDPVEFARIVLPRNFKHDNFSSFVRQLNTYKNECPNEVGNVTLLPYKGFRKVDTDKWEFANESFLRGERHLLKNIRRRRSTQVCSSSASHGGASSGLETEIEKLKKEKTSLMQEVVELQQQHQGTSKRVETVKQRIQASEEKQKQMVSFLAKVFQNPQFINRLQHMKEQRKTLVCPRGGARRRFVQQKPQKEQQRGQVQEVGGSSSSMMMMGDERIVNYYDRPEWPNLATADSTLGGGSVPSDYPLQHIVVGTATGEGDCPPPFRGKEIVASQLGGGGRVEDYFVSVPDDLAMAEYSSQETERLVIEDQLLNMGFDYDDYGLGTSAAGESSGNVVDTGPSVSSPELFDAWDLGGVQEPGRWSSIGKYETGDNQEGASS